VKGGKERRGEEGRGRKAYSYTEKQKHIKNNKTTKIIPWLTP
jgi:hypothetical protein